MIKLHHLRLSRSERILWLLEEIGVPYEIVAYDRDASFRAPLALAEIHPLGKSPVLDDGDLRLVESGAIVDHLVECYAPSLAPAPGTQERAVYRQWLHWCEGSLAAWLVMDLIANGGLADGFDAGPLRTMLPHEIGKALDWVERELSDRDFACGDTFSAADPMLGWALQFARSREHVADRPAISAYLARVEARPAHARAVELAA